MHLLCALARYSSFASVDNEGSDFLELPESFVRILFTEFSVDFLRLWKPVLNFLQYLSIFFLYGLGVDAVGEKEDGTSSP